MATTFGPRGGGANAGGPGDGLRGFVWADGGRVSRGIAEPEVQGFACGTAEVEGGGRPWVRAGAATDPAGAAAGSRPRRKYDGAWLGSSKHDRNLPAQSRETAP